MGRIWLVLIVLACAANASAQRAIHDDARDKSAQDASAAAKDIASGSLFTKMLANADAQAKREADTTMAWVEQQMRAKLEGFVVWSDPSDVIAKPLAGVGILAGTCKSLHCELASLDVALTFSLHERRVPTAAELKATLAALDKKKEQLAADLKALQTPKDDPAVVRAFALLEDPGKDIVDYAKKLTEAAQKSPLPINDGALKGVANALDQIGDGLDELLALYGSVKGIWAGAAAVSVDPASLRPPRQALEIRMLALTQDHLQTVAQIEARRNMDLGTTLDQVATALNMMASLGLAQSTERIEDTLRRQVATPDRSLPRRRELESTLLLLHTAAAAFAEQDAAGRLADLRLSDEERRLSIRRSAVNASAYDQTIQAAAQRLALYWKSGVKPADLAQLAFYLTNTIAIPAIAIK